MIIQAIGSGEPPAESDDFVAYERRIKERPPQRKRELQNALDILTAWGRGECDFGFGRGGCRQNQRRKGEDGCECFGFHFECLQLFYCILVRAYCDFCTIVVPGACIFQPIFPQRPVAGSFPFLCDQSPHVAEDNDKCQVDTETGEVKVLKLTSAFDVGRAINPDLVEGQITGGAVMGMGFALTENLLLRDGQILNSSFADYRLLRACDVPEIVPIIVESNEPTGPFGAKGIGEGCMVNVASAISNAICHATGVRLIDLCMTPDSILQGITSDEMT